MEDFLRVGSISNSHGIKGEVKVFPTTDDTNRFKKLKKAFIDTGKEKLPVNIETVKFFKNMVILKFKEFDDINQILGFKGKDLLVDRDNAVPLEKGQHFICDILDFKVFLDTDTDLEYGVLSDVLQTAANDVYVIKRNSDKKEILVPGIPECILDINEDTGKVLIHMLPGLED